MRGMGVSPMSALRRWIAVQHVFCAPIRRHGRAAHATALFRREIVTDALVLEQQPRRASRTFYYGWVNLAVAALAMVATLPGRTQGLGLITEPLLRDLHVNKVDY